MKTKSASQSAFFNLRVLAAILLSSVGVFLALLAFNLSAASPVGSKQAVIFGASYHNDVSPALRDMPAFPFEARRQREAMENPLIPNNHQDAPDLVVDEGTLLSQPAPSIPSPILSFPGIAGSPAAPPPPDMSGEAGATQYVQIAAGTYQIFDKATGNSILGPNSIESLWSGFGGLCQTSGFGSPVLVYDQIAKRWVITQLAGSFVPTDFCVAVSTTDDATGSYNRYGFHLGSNFIDDPKIAVWPDAYYMSVNVFNSSGTAYLGPQPFAFDRAKMVAGQPATFISMPALGSTHSPMLPADLDGRTKPKPGAPNSYVEWPGSGKYRLYHFHVDFTNPLISTFTLFASLHAAPFAQLCPGDPNCVPQLGTSSKLDAVGDRLMFRLAYRRFTDHESLVGNYTVASGGVAGIRWFELRGVTTKPVTVFQESTYQPDSTWRWLGSAAMDRFGNLAIGFSASSPNIYPQIRYAGRLATDPLNTLAQGEAHLYDGTGAQPSSAWGRFSDLTIDPVDDATFWYTNETYDPIIFDWRTRIGSFKF